MEKGNVEEFLSREGFTDSLTELLRGGATMLIKKAMEEELAEFIE